MRLFLIMAGLVLAMSCSKRSGLFPNLDGTKWLWLYTNEGASKTEPKKKDAFTLTFNDNRVAITTDCNKGNGTFNTDKNKIQIGDIMSTRMYCEGAQEPVFFDWLQKAKTFSVKGDKLIVLFDSGSLTFKRL